MLAMDVRVRRATFARRLQSRSSQSLLNRLVSSVILSKRASAQQCQHVQFLMNA